MARCFLRARRFHTPTLAPRVLISVRRGDVFRLFIEIHEVDAANVKRSISCVLVVFVNVWCCLVIPRRFTKNIVRKEAFL